MTCFLESSFGRTDLVLKLELIKKPIAFLILICMIPFGIFWMCVGRAVYDFIAFCFNCYYTKKLLDYGLFDQLMDLLPIIFNAGIMATCAWATTQFFDDTWMKLVVAIPAGAVLYVGGAYLLKDDTMQDVMGMLRKIRG